MPPRSSWAPEYLAAIVDSTDDAVIGKTLDGTIISWNGGAERIYGYTAEEAIGQPISILIPRDLPNELPAILERLRRGERIDHYKTTRVRKDGERITVSVTISPVHDYRGEIVGASAIARDITEQERAIDDALRFREHFISIAAHELRTPMTTVYARLQFLDRRLRRPELDRDGLLADLAATRTAAGRLRVLLERVLDISRIRAGKLELALDDADLVETARTVATEMADTVQRRIDLDVPSDPIPAKVDAVRIEEVIANLIDNAVKYSPAEAPIAVTVQASAADVRIAVRDRGAGVPPEQREAIFEAFHQANPDTQGVGLGLHIGREIMRLHGGTLEVEDADGGGARFVMTLPRGGNGASASGGDRAESRDR